MRRRLKAMIGCSVAALQDQYHHRLPSGHDTWTSDGQHLLALGALPRKRYRPKRARAPWESLDGPATTATRRDRVVTGKLPMPGPEPDATSLPAEPQTDPVIAGLLRQAVEEARTDSATIPGSRPAAPLAGVTAGNGRPLPMPSASSDTEGPSHGTA